MTDPELLEQFVKDTLEGSPTFSEEMMEKVREELLKAGKQASDYYAKKWKNNISAFSKWLQRFFQWAVRLMIRRVVRVDEPVFLGVEAFEMRVFAVLFLVQLHPIKLVCSKFY